VTRLLEEICSESGGLGGEGGGVALYLELDDDGTGEKVGDFEAIHGDAWQGGGMRAQARFFVVIIIILI